MADVTPQGLLQQAKCYECNGANPYTLQLMELALLAQIAQNGGGGGGGGGASVPAANYSGGQPNFTPTTSGALAIDTSNGRLWEWYNGTWN